MTDEPWQPDERLVNVVMSRRVDIKLMSGPDRAWVVASLSAAGWTGPAMAEQLRCSLRLIQQIKTEPMTQVAMYTLRLREEMAAAAMLHAVQLHALGEELVRCQRDNTRLRAHRDTVCARLVQLQGRNNGGQVQGLREPVRTNERGGAQRRAS